MTDAIRTIPRIIITRRMLWHILFYLCLIYNFHRYIFKYSHGAYPKEGYQQTPLVWQAGKFALLGLIMILIYSKSKFINRLPINLFLIYIFLSIVLAVNIGSFLLYGILLTDEIEYLIYAVLLMPLGFIKKDNLVELANEINVILNVSQYIIILSNWIVIFNYFQFRIIPFHAYEGVLMRFGGLWDDPNTLSIFSVFLAGYALFNKQYVLVVLHIINILLAISFNGYLLLFTLSAYFFLNTNRNRILRIFLFICFLGLIGLLAFLNLEFLGKIYEAKRESVEQHATLDLSYSFLPLLQPVQFHETWYVSMNVNYFPFSVPVTAVLVVLFVKLFFLKNKSLQAIMYILFFVSNLFLPFLYMFPVNFVSILFLIMYVKGVKI